MQCLMHNAPSKSFFYKDTFRQVEMIAGGPPCQGFSKVSAELGTAVFWSLKRSSSIRPQVSSSILYADLNHYTRKSFGCHGISSSSVAMWSPGFKFQKSIVTICNFLHLIKICLRSMHPIVRAFWVLF